MEYWSEIALQDWQKACSQDFPLNLLDIAHHANVVNSKKNHEAVRIESVFRCSILELPSSAPVDKLNIFYSLDNNCSQEFWKSNQTALRKLKNWWPDVIIGGPSIDEIASFALSEKCSLESLIGDIRKAGVGFIRCDGFNPDNYAYWLEVQRAASKVGMPAEVTINFEKASSLEKIKDVFSLLDKFNQEFNCLKRVNIACQKLSFEKQLLVCAKARILLPSCQHIAVKLDKESYLAGQIKLCFGVDTLTYEVKDKDTNTDIGLQELERAVSKSRRVLHSAVTGDASSALNSLETMLLYRLENDQFLQQETLLKAIAKTPLPTLGTLVKDQHSLEATRDFQIIDHSLFAGNYLVNPEKPLFLDFTGFRQKTQVSFDQIARFCEACGKQPVTIIGFHGLWQLAHQHGIDLADVFKKLKAAGASILSSSEDEGEENFTHSEIIDIHQMAHDFGLSTIAKIEIAASYDGSSLPFWKPFVSRLVGLSELNRKTHMIRGLMVQEAKSSYISIYEYLQAIAISRITMSQDCRIISPVRTLSQGILQPKRAGERSVKELIPLMHAFGASQMGLLLAEELRSFVATLQES